MLNLNHLKLIIVAYFLLALPLSAQDIVDMNRLIDVTTLAQLNAMRYDLDGNGEPTNDPATTLVDEAALYRTAFGISGAGNNTCTGGTCQGYELTDHLDFNADMDPLMTGIQPSAWAEGGTIAGGWVPIGDNSSPFNTTFEGNGNRISNLYISTTGADPAGLFGFLRWGGAAIRNLGLEGGSVTSTANEASVGSLVGDSRGTISACYSTVDVTGTGARAQVGGLVGYNQLQRNESVPPTISACYSTGNVTVGNNAYVGGLVGVNAGGRIRACYAIGRATGGNRAAVGGLIGVNHQGFSFAHSADSEVRASYSTGSATGGTHDRIGGLIGRNVFFSSSGVSVNCYFDSETSGRANAVGTGPTTGSAAKTTAQLQYPTAYAESDAAMGGTAIYSAWNVDIGGTSAADDPWDFVGHNRYPRLRVDFDGDAAPTAAEFGAQRFYFTKTDPGIEVFSLSVSDEAVAPTIIGYAKALSGTTTWALTDANFAINSGTGVITVKVAGATVATKMLSIEAMVGSVTTELNLNVEVTDVTAGSSSPTIIRFEDAAGTITSALRGATVKIIGTNFSTTPANNTITVGGIEVIPTSPTATVLTFTVPGAAAIGAGRIRASVLGAANYVESAFEVTLPSPTITEFQDGSRNTITSALIGDIVKIVGTNFSTTAANNTITVGGVTATPTNATATELTFTVPAGATPGSGPIRVTVLDAVTAAVLAFEVTAPPLAFAAASTTDADVAFTGVSGDTKAKYVVTKTLDEVDESGDVVLTLNVDPSVTTTYAYVDMDGADADAPTGLVSPIPASGAISTTAALAATSSATVFYVKATRDGASVIAKVELTVNAPLAFAAASESYVTLVSATDLAGSGDTLLANNS